jgi:hypothetical protein
MHIRCDTKYCYNLKLHGSCPPISLQIFGVKEVSFCLKKKFTRNFSEKVSICALLAIYILPATLFVVVGGYIEYQAYCTFDNPMKIDFAPYWYYDIPVPQLIVMPQVNIEGWVFFLIVISCGQNLTN